MPKIYTYDGHEVRHTDEMQDIINTVPSWLLRWGITLFFGLLVLIVGFSALIRYPDIVKTTLKIDSPAPDNEEFFGEMTISQNSITKFKVGQEVLIKLHSYPFEEYGILKGKITYIGPELYKDSMFMAKVDFKNKSTLSLHKPIHLKKGMVANAEIVTQDVTVLQRIIHNIIKIID